MEFANKREHTLWLIEQGGATNKSIEETVGISNKSRGTIFAQLRLMGKYPLVDENGVYRIGTADEFEAKKAAAANRKPTKTLTPEETLARAKKREANAAKALTTAGARLNMNPDSRELQLRHRIAELELELASVLLSEVEGQPNQDLDV